MELDAAGSRASGGPQTCAPCNVAIQTRLQLASIHHTNKLQGSSFLVQVYLLCVRYILALDFWH